jgi:hypothetical protein
LSTDELEEFHKIINMSAIENRPPVADDLYSDRSLPASDLSDAEKYPAKKRRI